MILIVGHKGQLGNELKKIYHGNEEALCLEDIDTLDISNKRSIEKYIDSHKNGSDFEVIINCAAYTAVDLAEKEEQKAYDVNYLGALNLAALSNRLNAPLIHISTDYVFDGKSDLPYKETDATNPRSVYGKSKLMGEMAIQEHAQTSLIIRTSWLYSSYGKNFVKTILKYAKERQKLDVVCDQVGTPTYAKDLAHVIASIVKKGIKRPRTKEIYHYSNAGVASWYEFAKEAVRLAGIEGCRINPVTTKFYPTPAPRPKYTVLSKDKIIDDFSLNIPCWKESLKKCLQENQF